MRVLSLTNEFEEEHFGGAGTAVTGMVYALGSRGVRQVVVVPCSDRQTPSWSRRSANLEVLWLPRALPYFGHLGLVNSTYVCNKFPELSGSWDMIHIQAINFAPLAYTVSAGRIPILYTAHSLLRDELDDDGKPELHAQFAIQDDLCHRSQRIHLLSVSQRNSLVRRFPQYLGKMDVLPLGLSGSFRDWRGENSRNFLFVGRLVPYKGIEDLLKALILARKKGHSFSLNVVGRGADYYMAHLAGLLKAGHLRTQVIFHGWESPPQVRQLMESSGILVVPSRRESYGLVALEGMAAGIPIISSNAGGLAELLGTNCALTFEAGNVKGLTQAMIEAERNPLLMRSLAGNARLKAAALQWDNLAGAYLQLYGQTLEAFKA